MATYEPPVSPLVKLGRPKGIAESNDYSTYDFGPEHIPELIRLLQDDELAWADSDTPDVYAQIHAWRALGQLRAEAAIEPLLDLLADQEDDENWSDWVTEEVPVVLAMIGPTALPAVVARLEQHQGHRWASTYFSSALTAIAKRHPATRDEVVQHLCRLLESAMANDPGFNGSLIGDLLTLRATEAWPTIERAFATANVDTFVAGDAADVKWALGLGPQPERRRPPAFISSTGRPTETPRIENRLRPTAKQRAEDRARQRKAEKRQKRKRRRR